jgi:competence protein ComEC
VRRFALGVLLGVCALQQLPSLALAAWLLVGAVVLLMLVYWVFPRGLQRGRPLGWGCVLGILWAGFGAHRMLADDLPQRLTGARVEVSGVIASLPEQDMSSTRFDWIPDDPQQVGGVHRLRVSWHQPTLPLIPGERWQLALKLLPRYGSRNPGGFDYETWLFRQGYDGTATVAGRAIRLESAPSFGSWVPYLRYQLGQSLREALGDRTHFAVLLSLAIGDRHALSDQQWSVFLKTGTNHLMAISGLHITLFALLGGWLSARIWARVPEWRRRGWAAQQVGALVGLMLAALYSALAGFSIPTLRTLLMLAAYLGAVLLRRHVLPSRTLALAMVMILLFDPLAVLDLSFWLSFGAVTLLLFRFGGRPTQPKPRARDAWLTQAGIGIGLMPCTLLLVGGVSWVSPLANALAVPVMSFVVAPMSILAALLAPLSSGLAFIVGGLADGIMSLLWWALSAMAEWSWAYQAMPRVGWFGSTALALGTLLAALPRGTPLRVLAIPCLLLPFFGRAAALPSQHLEMTLLDVGQGLAAVVRTAHHTLLFDTGAGWYADSLRGDGVIVPYLREQRVQALDAVVVSHADQDHRGGLPFVLDALKVERISTSEPERITGPRVTQCLAGERWTWDGVDFEFIYPLRSVPFARNDRSCVLRVRAGHHALLLTGDIEARAEAVLAHRLPHRLAADVLVVPHHGSRTSSSAKLLEAVQPTWALIPVGFANRYGHPHPEVVARYHERGVRLHRTDYDGAITLRMDAQGVRDVVAYRTQTQRYWHTVWRDL